MSEDKAKLTGPDLTKGVALSTIREGIMLLLGHAHGEPALLARRASEQELAAARRAFEADPGVQGLRERFGATVLPDSVRPVK